MTIEQEARICMAAIDRWGRDAQMIKAMEEMAELTHALCRYVGEGKHDRKTVENIREEIADVSIVIDQLKAIFGPEEVGMWRLDKLQGMAERLGLEDEGV